MGEAKLAAANPSTSGAWPIAPARRESDTVSSTMYMPANDMPHANAAGELVRYWGRTTTVGRWSCG